MKKYKKVIPYIIALSVFSAFIMTILIGIDYAMAHDLEELNTIVTICNEELTYRQILIMIVFTVSIYCLCGLIKNIANYLYDKIVKELKKIKKG